MRKACCQKEGLNKGAWTAEEDSTLRSYIKTHGEGKWSTLPKKAGLRRCGKSCRLRWKNYLKPDIKRGNISPDEEELIIRLHNLLGNRWSLIAGRLPGRTDNEIKNHWNSSLRKRLQLNQGQTTAAIITELNPPTNHLNHENVSPTAINDQASTSEYINSHCDVGVIRTKAVKCAKALVVSDLPPPAQQPQEQERAQEAPEQGQDPEPLIKTTEGDEGSSTLLRDLMSDFDRFESEFIFSEFMDLDVLDNGNLRSLVSSTEEMLQQWGHDHYHHDQVLDLNRPFASCPDHNDADDDDWLDRTEVI